MTQRRQYGFVLLTAVVLLALIATLMLGTAYHSATRATEARDAVVQLQRKWGMRTIEAALLPRAERMLEQWNSAAVDDGQVLPSCAGEIVLHGQVFSFIIADEQAKVNVNTLLREYGEEPSIAALRNLVAPKAPAAMVQLRPQRSAKDISPTLGSWAQVYHHPLPDAVLGFAPDHDGLNRAVTLWGDGRLAVARSSREALAAVAGSMLTDAQIRRLLRVSRERPEAGIDEWLRSAEVADEARQRLRGLLTGESRCFSVAVSVHDGWRRHWSLAICQLMPEPEAALGEGDEALESTGSDKSAATQSRGVDTVKNTHTYFKW